MKVYTTTPIHDKPYLATPVEVMMMLDMFKHWGEHTDEPIKIAPTPNGSDIYMFINPNQREWSIMRDASFVLLKKSDGSLAPSMVN